jgi:sirohydrochlorin cobaltochelatase
VALAFLERMTPTLEEAVAKLVADGATRIRIVPVFLGAGGHVIDELPVKVARLREQHAGATIAIAAPIGEQPRVIEAIAEAICADQ